MSVTRSVTVHCDCCGDWTDGATHSQTSKAALAAARCAGWHRVGPSADLCALCWEAGHRPPFRNGRCADTKERRDERPLL